jgi:hypothetical protein
MPTDFGSYTRGGGLVVETARTIDFGSYTRGGGLVIQSVHHAFSPTCRPVLGQTGGAADCSFVAGGEPVGAGAGYSPYPWWRPFFVWQPLQKAFEWPEPLPRQYVYISTGPTIRVFGAAKTKRVTMPRKVKPWIPTVPSRLVLPPAQAELIQFVPSRMIEPVTPVRRILVSPQPSVTPLAEQRMRDDDEVLLLLT